jgi:SAM-dependent methyltransferase/catechol 2,3-dioxygenase-like lactoylglutathione lyase family enzyme
VTAPPISHVDLVVTSIERSLAFYRGLLEPLGWTRGSEVRGERGETIHYMSTPGPTPALGLRQKQSDAHPVPYDRYAVGIHHICFEVSSREVVDERARWAAEHGATIESAPREYDYTPGYYAFFLYDPDGLKLEVLHRPRGREGEAGPAASGSRPEAAVRWGSADAYEPYVGRWSRLVAREFVQWLSIAPNSRWLDVGCGTRALSGVVLELATPIELVGVEPSESYVDFARRRLDDRRASFLVGDALSLPVGRGAFDVAVAGLVLNFVPEREKAVSQMARAVGSGGTVAAYVWDYAEGMEMIRRFWDAACALDPAAEELDEGRRFPDCNPEALATLLRDAGLEDVQVRAIEVPTRFRDFEDYWSPFLGGDGPAPSYVGSLDEQRRVALRERLRSTLSPAADGSLELSARAWAVLGRC